MPITKFNDTAYHEAGHAIIAYLIPDLFKIEMLTANKEKSLGYDRHALGGIKGKIVKDSKQLNIYDHDKLALLFMAGMAADDMNHANNNIDSKLYNDQEFGHKINSFKYSFDIDLFSRHLNNLKLKLAVKEREYTLSCQKLLYQIFTDEVIGAVILNLRHTLISNPGQTISGENVISFLDNSDLNLWKSNNWTDIQAKRGKQLNNWLKPNRKSKYEGKNCIQKFFIRLFEII